MERRAFLGLLGSGAVAWPLAALAEQKPMPVIGFLSAASPGPFASRVAEFRQGLKEAGYIEGQNVIVEYRWAEGQYDRLAPLASELVERGVAVIATTGGPVPALAAKNAISTIPIVFASGSDPFASGLVASLARPGGNVTGVSMLLAQLTAKRLELLSELVSANVIALLVKINNPEAEQTIREAQEAARAKGVQVPILKAGSESEINAAFQTLPQLHAGALLVGSDPFYTSRLEKLVTLASQNAIPAMYFNRAFTASGGLISYAPNVGVQWRQLGNYAGRVLKGAKPADLPVLQPTMFELVINLKTAKALGLTVPPSLLARADEVIE
jgi:putative ABC transport system substrate-binding protein